MSFIVRPLAQTIFVLLCATAEGEIFMWLISLWYCNIQVWVGRNKILPQINYNIMRTLLLSGPRKHPTQGVGASSQPVQGSGEASPDALWADPGYS